MPTLAQDTSWTAWNATYTITEAATTTWVDVSEQVWSTWNATTTGDTTIRVIPNPRPETPEERAELVRRAQERRHNAQQAAEELLLSCLDEEQTQCYQDPDIRSFIVRASSGRQYEISCDRIAGNVYSLDEDCYRTSKFCIHPNGIPNPDVWLAQKLLIETDEQAFLRIANRSPAWDPYPAIRDRVLAQQAA